MACRLGEEGRNKSFLSLPKEQNAARCFLRAPGLLPDGGQSQKGPRLPQESSSLETVYEIHFPSQEREILISFFSFYID